MAHNTKKIRLHAELAESAATYASSLDEIGGKGLAELLLEDDEEPKAKRALSALKGSKHDEAVWICGWFRGVGDALKCDPIAVLRAGRTAVVFDVDGAA